MAVRDILLDTNAYAAFKRNAQQAVEVIRHAPRIVVTTVVLGELLSGFAAGTRAVANAEELSGFLDSDRVRVVPIDEGTARFYAVVYRDLRQKGRPIPTNDMWIAASSLQHGLAVFTYDKHFRAVDGIVVGDNLAAFLL